MIQMISALLAGAFLLSSCGKRQQRTDGLDLKATNVMCVHNYAANTETISIYFDTAIKSVPKIQHIPNVSMSSANETIANLGMCSEVLVNNGSSY